MFGAGLESRSIAGGPSPANRVSFGVIALAKAVLNRFMPPGDTNSISSDGPNFERTSAGGLLSSATVPEQFRAERATGDSSETIAEELELDNAKLGDVED